MDPGEDNLTLMDLNNNILYHEELGFGPELVRFIMRVSYPTLPQRSNKAENTA